MYLSAKIDGETQTTLLSAVPLFSDMMFQIIFAGDIDGDGIINNSWYYNAIVPTLYLSKLAKKQQIVVPVGFHFSVGC